MCKQHCIISCLKISYIVCDFIGTGACHLWNSIIQSIQLYSKAERFNTHGRYLSIKTQWWRACYPQVSAHHNREDSLSVAKFQNILIIFMLITAPTKNTVSWCWSLCKYTIHIYIYILLFQRMNRTESNRRNIMRQSSQESDGKIHCCPSHALWEREKLSRPS